MTLAVEELGAGDPLVLIHGLAATRHVWSPVVSALSGSRRVVTLDLPGFGQSDPIGPGFDLDAVAELIARGLAARGVSGPYDLVGHSLGAGVALTLAAARPRLVRSLVLVAPAGFARIPRPLSLALTAGADGMLAARRRLAPLTDLRWGRRLLLAFAAADGASLSPAQARMIVEASATARRTAPALATITAADLRPLLRRAPAPLGLIWGTADRTVPASVAGLVRSERPDAELELIERAGHVAMIERPEAFVHALGALLTRLSKLATSPTSPRSTFA